MGYQDDCKVWSKGGSADEIISPELGSAGTSVNLTFEAAKFGNGFRCDANGEYATFQTIDLVGKQQGMIGVWLKTDFNVTNGVPQSGSTSAYIVQSYNGGNGIGVLFHASGINFIYWYGGTARILIDNTSDWLAGTWKYILVVWDTAGIEGGADTMRIYVDDAMTANGSGVLGAPGAWQNIFVFGCSWAFTSPARGVLDNPKIYETSEFFQDAIDYKDTEGFPVIGSPGKFFQFFK